MATRSLKTSFTTSLVVLLLLVFDATASDDQDAVHRNSVKITSSRGSGDLSRADDSCPAVCPAAPPCPRTIPPGYKLYEPLGYYKLHYEHKTWDDAKAACEREGGYLVVIDSQEEADLTTKLLNKYDVVYIFTGFFDVHKNGTYVTVLDEPMDYQGWVPGEPNHVGTHNCGSFYHNGIDDGPCDYPSPFLCELLP